MTDDPNHTAQEGQQKVTRISWPADTFDASSPANRFVFSIHDSVGYFAFGQVSPVPYDVGAPDEKVITVVSAVAMPIGMFAGMRHALNEFVDENPGIFGGWEPSEPDPTPES